MRRVSHENSIKSPAPTSIFRGRPSTTKSTKSILKATMARKVLTREDRSALAQKRGYSVHSTSEQQHLLNQTEQSSLASVTQERHEDVGELW